MADLDMNAPKVEGSDELFEFLDLVNKRSPSQENIAALEEWIDSHPQLFSEVWNLSKHLKRMLVSKIHMKESYRASLNKEFEIKSRDLGADQAPALERLLIDNVVVTWLRLQWVEMIVTDNMDKQQISTVMQLYLDRRLSAAQRRHLRACETLARVRKLARNTPALQVNIATQEGQQVNITGDIVRKTSVSEEASYTHSNEAPKA